MVQSLPISAAQFLVPPPSIAQLPKVGRSAQLPRLVPPASFADLPHIVPPARSAQLPHLVLQHEHAPVNVGWPSVSATVDASQVTALRGKKLDPSPAGALLDALDELLSVRDPHAVFRIAAKVCLERLGLHEPGVLLVDESGEHLCGTWRAAPDGSLSDERGEHLKLGLLHRQAEARAHDPEGSYTVFSGEAFPRNDTETVEQKAPQWTALTPIMGRDRLIGFLVNIGWEGAPDQAVQTRAAVLCRALGGLLEDIERCAQSLPWDSLLARRPFVVTTPEQSLVAGVLRALYDDASVSNRTLAARLGVSTSYLSSVFRHHTELSLTRYRNRLRIERFLTQVDSTGGNLFQAAFHAGFGSYAQFHRVFRELLGATPRDCLEQSDPGSQHDTVFA